MFVVLFFIMNGLVNCDFGILFCYDSSFNDETGFTDVYLEMLLELDPFGDYFMFEDFFFTKSTLFLRGGLLLITYRRFPFYSISLYFRILDKSMLIFIGLYDALF